MTKINVMQVMPEFGLAGAETMCECLCNELSKLDYVKLTVVSLYDFHSPITERLEEKGIEVVYLGKKSGMDFSITKKLTKLMKEKNINVVHTHRYVMQYAIPAAKRAGVKARVHTVHSVATEEVDKFRRLLAKIFYKHRNVRSVAISPRIRDTIYEEYGIDKNDIAMVYNGSDLSKCNPKSDYSANGKFSFIHVGRMVPVKNQQLIIEAAEVLKNKGYEFTVDFIGGGEKEQEYKDEVLKRGLEDFVIFNGLQSDVHQFLSRSDCFLLPSLYEGMPVTLIEAMGTALPIIASRVGGVPDMIEDGVSGILIEPNLEELVAAMQKIMDDQKLREAYGCRAKQKSVDFSATNMLEGYLRIYNEQLS